MLKKATYDNDSLEITIDFQYEHNECNYNITFFNVKTVYFIDDNIVFCV